MDEQQKKPMSISEQNLINQFQNPEKFCFQCNRTQTPDNIIKSPLGPGWDICMACLTAQAKIIVQHKESKPRLYPQISQILPGLYLGNQDAAICQKTIQQYKIRAVCVCGSYLLTPFQKKQCQGQFPNIHYIRYDIDDFYDQKISQYFDDNCDWIQKRLKQGRNVLIHCAAGVSRSASFTIAYMMNKKQMLYPDAIRYVKERRKVIRPNSGFMNQLQQYGKVLFQRKLGSKFMMNENQNNSQKQKQEI